jgi:hypothetical protein
MQTTATTSAAQQMIDQFNKKGGSGGSAAKAAAATSMAANSRESFVSFDVQIQFLHYFSILLHFISLRLGSSKRSHRWNFHGTEYSGIESIPD